MKERFKEILDSKGMNARQLSESIGVLPSSISHILTGRNKPGVELLQKLLEKFPDLDIYYLLTGNRKVMKSPVEKSENEVTSDDEALKDLSGIEKTMQVSGPPEGKSTRIVIFHGDGTFEEFRPM